MKSKRIVAVRRRQQRGSSLLESTFCLTAFIFLTLGLMDFSLAVYAYNFCTFAASDAARFASMHGSHSAAPATATSLQTRVRGEAVALVSNNVTVTTTWVPDNQPGGVVQVQVAYVVSPMMNLMLNGNMNVSSTSKMVISN